MLSYTLKRRHFMKNLTYILLLGLIGTMISMILLSISILIFNEMVFEEESDLKLLPMEWLLFAAVLWATDSVSVLSVVKEKMFPTLNSILFGEGIVNDAVSILIYEAVANMITTAIKNNDNDHNLPITFIMIIKTWWNFIYISILSIAWGSIFGLISAFLSKYFTSFKECPPKEVSLILLLSYLSYLVSEVFGLSAIMSLFAWGVTMSHYTFHNISENSKKGSVMAINTLGHAAEAFLFIYLGIGIYTTDQQTYNMKLTVFIIIGGLFSRISSVLIPIWAYAKYNNWKITIGWKELVIICFSGTIRGAIAFALSLKINPHIAPHK